MSEWRIHLAAQAIQGGGVIACPTEAVYGLSCLPSDEQAVKKLLRLKRRSVSKGLILVAASAEQLAALVEFENSPMIEEIRHSWPGPVSWILPCRRDVPPWLRGNHPSLAVRVSAHPLVVALCRICGPLVSTSANLAGTPPARSALQVRNYFGDQLAYILSGKLGGAQRPSEIRDGKSGKILRPGN